MNSFEISKGTHNIINILHQKIIDINNIVKETIKLKEETKDIFNFEDIKHVFPQIDCELFTETPHLFSNKGRILVNYNCIQNKEKYTDLINDIAIIDYYNSICILINDSENKNSICFPTYLENTTPIINVKELFHPYLSDAVPNDILIGKKKSTKYNYYWTKCWRKIYIY